MSDPHAHWSDEELARDLSQRLEASPSASRQPDGDLDSGSGSYTRFCADRFIPSTAPTAPRPAAESGVPVTEPPAGGFSSWTELLQWTMDLSGALACFVVDSQGFVLAHQGQWAYEDIEDVGSQLTVIMTRADETEAAGKSKAITLEFGDFWVFGCRLDISDLGEFTFVIISQAPIPRSLGSELAWQVRRAMLYF